jgi:hypothetical protein
MLFYDQTIAQYWLALPHFEWAILEKNYNILFCPCKFIFIEGDRIEKNFYIPWCHRVPRLVSTERPSLHVKTIK